VTNLIGLGLLFGAALLQTTLSPYMKIGGIHPDLVLLLVIGWSALRGMEEGATWAFIGGISLDILSSAPFGVFRCRCCWWRLLPACFTVVRWAPQLCCRSY
jgi:rod shape-determining protein MreD